MGYERPIGGFANGWSATASQAYVWAAYAVAIGLSTLVAYLVGDGNADILSTRIDGVPVYPLVLAGVADAVATIIIWIAAIIVNNSSLYDAYWSVYTPVVFWYWFLAAEEDDKQVPVARSVLVGVSCWFWAIRLTTNWMTDFPGLRHEDFRYVNIRGEQQAKGIPKWGYWLTGSLMGIMYVPTLLVYLATAPVFMAVYAGGARDGATDFNAGDVAGTVICVGAATIQFVADAQMRRWRKQPHEPTDVMEEGLWYYSRHPNYFGEQAFWFGLYVHALAAKPEYWWSGLGFVLMVLLFTFISVPMMETRMLKKRPQYKRVQQTTSMIIPFFRFSSPDAQVGNSYESMN